MVIKWLYKYQILNQNSHRKKGQKIMDNMKKKKSAGPDGLSQKRILMRKEVLVIALTNIVFHLRDLNK